MSLVILARHGQALSQSYVTSDQPGSSAGLSELGRQQAHVLGVALGARGIRPDVALSGGLARQTETAEIALTAMGLPGFRIEEDPRWREYDVQRVLATYPAGPGGDQAAAASAATINPRGFQRILDQSLRAWMLDPAPPPELMLWADFAAGALDALQEAAPRGGRQTVVAFTSGGPIAALAADLLGAATPESVLRLHRVVVNGSVTKIISGSRGMHLSTFNEHGHLEAGGCSVTYR